MRLDVLLAKRGLVPSREAAKAEILAGHVFIGGKPADKPSREVLEDADIELRGSVRKFVGRGGAKLEHALEVFGVEPAGAVCVDVGASTGGFTDCLLRRGAKLVYAIDVGHNQLDESLRRDSRVVSLEGVNARELYAGMLDPPPELAVVDVSFISLSKVLPSVKSACAPNARLICLVKPQFEAGRSKIGKNGVVKRRETHIEVLEAFFENAKALGYAVGGLTYSPVRAERGNIEFLALLSRENAGIINIKAVVYDAHTNLRG